MRIAGLLFIMVAGLFGQFSLAEDFCVSTAEELHNALIASQDNGQDDVVKVVRGVYVGNFEYVSTENNDISIIGGYDDQCLSRTVERGSTIIDGARDGRVLLLYIPDNYSDVVIDGVDIKNGFLLSKNARLGSGSGVYIGTKKTAVVLNVAFYDNKIESSVNSYGAGLAIDATQDILVSDSWFERNVISQSMGSSNGGGLYIDGSIGPIVVESNLFSENITDGDGAGVYLIGGDSQSVIFNDFNNNIANYGGAIYQFCNTNTDDALIGNNIIYKNKGYGSGLYITAFCKINIGVFNNTMSGNSGGDTVRMTGKLDSTFVIKNNIIISKDGHLSDLVNNPFFDSSFVVNNNLSNSSLSDVVDSSNLISDSEVFVDIENDDYHLADNSVAIDAGDLYFSEFSSFDLNGNLRMIGAAIDIGAYEYQGDGPVVVAWNPVTNEMASYLEADTPIGWITTLPISTDDFTQNLPATFVGVEVDGEEFSDDCKGTFYSTGDMYSICYSGPNPGGQVRSWILDGNRIALLSDEGVVESYNYLLENNQHYTKAVFVDVDFETYHIIKAVKVDSSAYVQDEDADTIPDVLDAFPDNSLYSQDTDSDGLPDEWESSRIGSLNSFDTSDTDSDGFTDLQEFTVGTDPLVVTVQTGFTQAEVDSVVVDAKSTQIQDCVNSPASCGIDVNPVTTIQGYTQSELDTAQSTAEQAGKDYVTNNPSEFDLFTLSDLSDTKSEQVTACFNAPSSCGITIYGTTDSSANHTYTITEGWNMIGGKDASDTTAIQTFMNEHNADSIWHWDGDWKMYIKRTPEFLNGLQSMEGNKGYWLHVPEQ